ncbi:GNAT family N-acetyltransferase [Myroides pelagicus]|uniref:GNAT family N-acetyltransferase n=1 Tax=Myroides pelagicus TaxID=270914 RepID=UPI001396B476|nr:GNAT family N-acetyltransferase [Myroides pelagicus]MEC4113858.1 GNAT family N-acetyltransferase [Myroides pelagicus]
MGKSEINTIDYSVIPWNRLIHWEGRANNVPTILSVLEHGARHDRRMALVTLSGFVEQKGGVIIATPILLSYLLNNLDRFSDNQDLVLRLLLKVAKAVGLQWEVFLDSKEFEGLSFSASIWEEGSPYLWPKEMSAVEEASLWNSIDPMLYFDHAWYYTLEVLESFRLSILSIDARDGIEQGMIYELETILNMVASQNRNIVAIDNFSFEYEDVLLSPIDQIYLDDIHTNLTKDVSKFLSFDLIDNVAFTKEYIRASVVENKRGAALVLVVKDRHTQMFLGGCGIQDVNVHTAEIGFWLKKEVQGKGYGRQVVGALLKLIKECVDTKEIIYTVEQGNEVSVYLAEKLGFSKGKDFILEPTVFKNKLRYMSQYRLTLK